MGRAWREGDEDSLSKRLQLRFLDGSPYEHGSDIDLTGSLVLPLELDVSWEALTTLAVRGVSRRRRERWRSIRVLVHVLRRLQGQI